MIIEKVIVFSGHMIDKIDRKLPRFPANKEKIVYQNIINQLKTWNIGKDDLGICGGACGGDILFAEACLELGAKVKLHIPLPETEFITRSVNILTGNWEKRFQTLNHHPQVSKYYLNDYQGNLPEDISVFAQNNVWIIQTAIKLVSPENLYALLVWDEKPTGDGIGGTSDFAKKIHQYGGNISIINPTKL
jgi:hypothetical protein